MNSPEPPIRAGMTVRAANIVARTAVAAPRATPCMKFRPSSSRPSRAMTTVIAANITVRPAVSIAISTASSRSSPALTSAR
jgi:hypothetical protein